MKIYLFKKTVLNCKQATLLSLKRDDGSISVFEGIRLFYHLLFCDFCKRFIEQSHLIDDQMKTFQDALYENSPHRLSDKSRNAIQEEIDKLL